MNNIPLENYPRPSFKRDSYICLNGMWDFSVLKNTETLYNGKILVPYCVESKLSKVNTVFGDNCIYIYKREFILPESFIKGKVILNFGAVDQCCSVFINDVKVGEHTGGYNSFSFDITKFLKEENTITVYVTDNLSNGILPYGKQKIKRGGMWYTPVSGIWQTVWLESVPEVYFKGVKTYVTLNTAILKFNGIESGEVILEDKHIKIENSVAEITVENPINWSPETPKLYYYTAISGNDKIESYFALRTIEIKDIGGVKRVLLNGKPYFFNGLLDQGCFEQGIYTPKSYTDFSFDILSMKKLGFNMLRKHIKVEPDIFYYECDRLGMAVFQDMVNNGDYSFIRDTALPTIGLTGKNDKNIHKNKKIREAFILGMEATVNQLYNFACILEWTIFNEGWGQFCADDMYIKLKNIDCSRPIDSASGWFKSKLNDFDSRHIYFKKIKAKPTDKPLYISEFGGYSYKILNHCFNKEKNYGYGKFKDKDSFVKAFRNLYLNQIIPLIEKGLCGAVYTQLSDVEDETNGILTYDRMVQKIDENDIADIKEKINNINKR